MGGICLLLVAKALRAHSDFVSPWLMCVLPCVSGLFCCAKLQFDRHVCLAWGCHERLQACIVFFLSSYDTLENTHTHTQPGCDTSCARSRFRHFPLILDRVRSGSGWGSHEPRRFPQPEMCPLHAGSRPNIIRKLTVTARACAQRRTRETRCTSTGVCSVRTCRAVSKAAQCLWSHHAPRPTTSME